MDAWAVGRIDVGDGERELVERHAAGDAGAFDELYARFSGMVFGIALRMSGGREDALDIAQEVFLRIHRHLARFRGSSSLKTWIYRITLNQCRTAVARARTRPSVIDDQAVALGVLDPAAGPEVLAARHEFFVHVERALGALAPEFREALVLRDVDELSYEEIASVLGVPLGTVRSRIARGRERLRTRMEGRS